MKESRDNCGSLTGMDMEGNGPGCFQSTIQKFVWSYWGKSYWA